MKPWVQKIKRELGPLWNQLKPYQRRGVGFFVRRKGRGLLADEMGLGKTVQVLAYLRLTKEKTVIVVPATVKWNWLDEAKKWVPERKCLILSGKFPHKISFEYDTIIVNYDILQDWVNEIKIWGPKTLVADEAHYLKNAKAKRTKAFVKIAAITMRVIALTGTPVVNAPIEFYRIIRLIDPTLFPSFWHYAQKFCNPKHNGFGWNFNGASNEEELFDILTKRSGIMLRRLKKDVLQELPVLRRSVIKVKTSSSDMIKIDDFDLAALEEARQNCLKIKMPFVIDWIKTFLETGLKLVVFAHHRSAVSQLKSVFKDCLIIDGTVTGEKRNDTVKAFQNDPTKQLLVGNIKAAGIGITLTAASHALFIELPWTPGDIRQAEDRLHRIGQTERVNIWYILVEDSVETDMMNLIDAKSSIISRCVNGEEVSMEELLKNMKGSSDGN